MRMSLCKSTVTSHSPMMCIFPRTFMTLCNGLRPVKDSLTVPLYCQADLRLAQTFSLESSTDWIKCYNQFQVLLTSTSSVFLVCDLIFFPFDEWRRVIPPPLPLLIAVLVRNTHAPPLSLSHSYKNLLCSLVCWLTQGQTPTLRLQKCTFSQACMQITYFNAHWMHHGVQKTFISLFISIISHNYTSVLSGSVQLKSKCLLLALTCISHSRRGGWVRNGGFHE